MKKKREKKKGEECVAKHTQSITDFHPKGWFGERKNMSLTLRWRTWFEYLGI